MNNEDIIRCIEIYKRINEISYENKEVESLWDEYVLIFKTLSHYQKSCLVKFFIDSEYNYDIIDNSFFMNKSSIDTEMLYFRIHVNNKIFSGDMFYNFKDVGCYVKYNNKIFKIEALNTFGDIIHNGEIINKHDCSESSLKELRISKIDNLLNND